MELWTSHSSEHLAMQKMPNLTPLQSPQLITYKCLFFLVHKDLIKIASKLIQIKGRKNSELEFHVSMEYAKPSFHEPNLT